MEDLDRKINRDDLIFITKNTDKSKNSFSKKINLLAFLNEEPTEQEAVGLKILTPKKMLQSLPIALGQVKASNNSESLLNEIRQIVYSLYQSKEITKKVYNNINKSKQLQKWILYL